MNNPEYALKVSPVEIFQADTKANIDSQVATAQQFKRDIRSVLDEIVFYATRSMEIADSCFYTIKRDGKTIRGASIRLAEIIASCYGNIRATARIVSNDGRTVTAQGICWDLQKNVAYSIDVSRKITYKDGTPYTEDMQVVTSNACCAIALRNAILKVIPSGMTYSAQEEIKKYILDGMDLKEVRVKAVEYFEAQGVAVKDILALFDKKSVEELTSDDIFDLRGIASAIREGDTTIELAFSIAPKSNAFGKASRILSTPIEPINHDLNMVSEEKKLDVQDGNIKEPDAQIKEKKEETVSPVEEQMKEPKSESKVNKSSSKGKNKSNQQASDDKSGSTLFEIEE